MSVIVLNIVGVLFWLVILLVIMIISVVVVLIE